jgi:hypothetical protein
MRLIKKKWSFAKKVLKLADLFSIKVMYIGD